MQTHTIRNKSKQPILRFSKKFLSMLKTCYPEAVSLVLTKFKQDYLRHTAKVIVFDYEQAVDLDNEIRKTSDSNPFGITNIGVDTYNIKSIFIDGFMRQPLSDFQEDLHIAQSFYKMLDDYCLRQKTNQTETT